MTEPREGSRHERDAKFPTREIRLGLGLNQEEVIEAYYNVVLTGWLNATVDLQVIDSALNKTLTAT